MAKTFRDIIEGQAFKQKRVPQNKWILRKIVFTRRFILFLFLQTRSFCRDAHLLLCNLSQPPLVRRNARPSEY